LALRILSRLHSAHCRMHFALTISPLPINGLIYSSVSAAEPRHRDGLKACARKGCSIFLLFHDRYSPSELVVPPELIDLFNISPAMIASVRLSQRQRLAFVNAEVGALPFTAY
jgi:hypothetical protein